jgi:ATP-binding cassette subfamily F protein uup
MNLVTLKNVSKQFSERLLLDQVELLINQGDRIGLIGPNGSGKTTLLEMIAGRDKPDQGELTVWGGVRLHYLAQNPQLDDRQTILDYVFQSEVPQLRLLHAYEQANEALQREPDQRAWQNRLAELGQELERTGAWAAEAMAKTILSKLGFSSFSQKISQLSGGQRRRVALAQALISPADLLILDEPTNHIDVETIAWLEGYLTGRTGALLLVTHDRYFLDRMVTRIVELDRRQLINYPGAYRHYLELRTARHEQLAAAERKQQNLLRRELAWLRRGAMARSTKQKARKQRVETLQQLDFDRAEQRVAMALAGRRLGKQVLQASNLSKSFPGQPPLFSGLDFNLKPGDRIGLIGPNGSGKTTLLNILAGKLSPDSGAVQWGETVQLGYYDQQSAGLVESMRVAEFIEAETPLIRSSDGERVTAWQMLEWFLFSRPAQQSYISRLSGGEQRRLYLLHVLAQQPNVLFLDEPTNDLDIQTLTVLEEFLDHFNGCLVVASHDRYFLDRTTDYLVTFAAGRVGERYPGPYETYRALAEAAGRPAAATPPAAAPAQQAKTGPDRPRKLSYKEQQELSRLEAEIETLEATRVRLAAEINRAGSDFTRLQGLAAELEAVQNDLAQAEARWLALSELAEGG